ATYIEFVEVMSRNAHICPFIFSCYRHPRYLHSFPTRRSSDLATCMCLRCSSWRRGAARRISRRSPGPASRSSRTGAGSRSSAPRSEEHTSELQSQSNLVCRLLLEKKKTTLSEDSHDNGFDRCS